MGGAQARVDEVPAAARVVALLELLGVAAERVGVAHGLEALTAGLVAQRARAAHLLVDPAVVAAVASLQHRAFAVVLAVFAQRAITFATALRGGAAAALAAGAELAVVD